jgi:hypothetical protein
MIMDKEIEPPFEAPTPPTDTDMYLRYLGVLGLLGECSVYVPEEIRETIKMAMDDAASHHPLRVIRMLDRIEIEPLFNR